MELMPTSFRYRIVLLFMSIGFLVGVPIQTYVDHVFARQLLEDRGSELHDLAKSIAAVFGENLKERQHEITFLADSSSRDLANGRPVDRFNDLTYLQRSHPYYSWIGYAGADGIVRQGTGHILEGQSVAARPWFQNGMHGPYVGELHEALMLAKALPYVAGTGPVRFIDFAAPVRNAAGTVEGVLAAHVHWRWAGEVSDVLRPSVHDNQHVDIFIINAAGHIIFPDDKFDQPLNAGPGVKAGSTYSTVTDINGKKYLIALSPIPDVFKDQPLGWQIVVRQPSDELLGDVRSLQRFLFLLGVTAVFVFLVLGLWSARHLSKPIENLTTMARAIADGDEHVKINVKTGAQDIMRLAESVNDMATSLIHRKEGLAQLNAELEQRVNARTAELNKANEELTLLARKDALTGLGNRFATNERLQIEFSRQRRNGRPYVVLLGDIDHFKAVNDTLGHEMGDQVLKFVAHTLAVSCRETDFVGRYGGEEFLVILPDTSLDSALHVAEKIRKAVEESPPPTGNRVTLSIGVGAVNAADENPEAAVKRADENLYRAKELGRNRVASG